MTQPEAEEPDARLAPGHDDLGSTPVDLGFAGVVLQRDEHLGTVGAVLPHILADHRLTTSEPVLRHHQAVVDSPRRVSLLGWPLLVLSQPVVDDR